MTQALTGVDTRSMAFRWAGLAGEGLRLALVAAAYFVAARLGLELALVNGQVTPVWPPTGIALVAILLFGVRVWPAIAVAAFAVNLPIGPNPLGAALIAAGNTLAPVTAAYLLKVTGFRLELDRLRDAGLIVLAALAGMAISATIGSLVLVSSGRVAVTAFPQTWAVWWTGDAMGVLLVAPFLLCFLPAPSRRPLSWRRRVELALLLATVAVVTFVEFQNQLRLEYLVLPLIMVAALRFRLRGAAPAALIASAVAVWAAVKGTGPFATETLLQKMITLQVFNVFVTLSSFVLSSYVETRDAAQRARVANETKSEFLRVAAHELRSPLSVLTGYLSLLSAGDLGKPPEKWKRPLEILTAKTAELNNVMDQLLEVARLDGDVMAPARQVIDLRTVVEDAVERARPRAALVEGEIDVELGSEAVHVMGDVTQLGHVVDNLINNALAYSEGAPRVSVMAMNEASRAVVRVADRGIGVDDEMRDAIFEPFRRGEHDHAPGSGLGLYISRELARAHGGTLALERSAPGVGSTFVLALPRRVTEASIRA